MTSYWTTSRSNNKVESTNNGIDSTVFGLYAICELRDAIPQHNNLPVDSLCSALTADPQILHRCCDIDIRFQMVPNDQPSDKMLFMFTDFIYFTLCDCTEHYDHWSRSVTHSHTHTLLLERNRSSKPSSNVTSVGETPVQFFNGSVKQLNVRSLKITSSE